ncbi:unnamed protein product [Rotaria sp. Silwood1]|nr:unnamed protein product [Rotaria sp. Silwood1]
MSKISTARLLCVSTVVFWSLHGLPIVIMVNIYPAAANQTVCVNRSTVYAYYLNYFIILILYNVLPLAIFVAFGLLTWKNIHKIHRRRIEPQQQRLSTNQRQEYQLTRMLMLQVSSITISTIPYTINSLFEWQPSLVDVRQQRLYLSIKNNLSLLVQEQTYMDDVRAKYKRYGDIIKVKYDALESNE